MMLYKGQLEKLTNEKLFELRIALDKEMVSRGLKFSVGEIGETMAINYFNSTAGFPNLMAAPTGAKNVDALSRDGDRYSIKAVQKAKKTGTIYPDSKNKDKQLFEYLLVVQLDEKYELLSLHRFSWKQFQKVKAWDKRMNAWYIPVSKSRLDAGELVFKRKK